MAIKKGNDGTKRELTREELIQEISGLMFNIVEGRGCAMAIMKQDLAGLLANLAEKYHITASRDEVLEVIDEAAKKAGLDLLRVFFLGSIKRDKQYKKSKIINCKNIHEL